ncbi:MAG: hypothetical protein ACQEQZ_04115 [Pseudomonadota bacterium]
MKVPQGFIRPLLSGCCFIGLTCPVAAATGLSSCKPLLLDDGSGYSAASSEIVSPRVSLQLQPGQLEPQIRRLLRQHLAIKVLDWQASPHHQWPTEHLISADSWLQLLQRVLKPYQLQLVLHPNQSAVVRYRETSSS